MNGERPDRGDEVQIAGSIGNIVEVNDSEGTCVIAWWKPTGGPGFGESTSVVPLDGLHVRQQATTSRPAAPVSPVEGERREQAKVLRRIASASSPETVACKALLAGAASLDAAPAPLPVDSEERPDAGPNKVIAALASTAFTNSERWFPGVHGRGHEAVTTHLGYGIGGEAGEVLDVLKKADICGLVETCDMHADGKHGPSALGAEMADLFTYLLNLAHHHGIDLVDEFERKQAVCAERWDR